MAGDRPREAASHRGDPRRGCRPPPPPRRAASAPAARTSCTRSSTTSDAGWSGSAVDGRQRALHLGEPVPDVAVPVPGSNGQAALEHRVQRLRQVAALAEPPNQRRQRPQVGAGVDDRRARHPSPAGGIPAVPPATVSPELRARSLHIPRSASSTRSSAAIRAPGPLDTSSPGTPAVCATNGIGRDQHVRRAEVTVHDLGGVHGIQGRRQGPGEHEHIRSARRPARGAQGRHPLRQRPPVGMLEHEVRLLPVALADVVHRHDVRAADPAQAASFGDEAFPHVRVQAVVLGEHLEHHRGIEPLVGGDVGRGERADADDLTEAVSPDATRLALPHHRSCQVHAGLTQGGGEQGSTA